MSDEPNPWGKSREHRRLISARVSAYYQTPEGKAKRERLSRRMKARHRGEPYE